MSDSLRSQFYIKIGGLIKNQAQSKPVLYSCAKSVYNYYCKMVSPFYSVRPDFIIIGVLKSGTTSLYEYLLQHPSIHACLVKEPNYFNIHYHDRPPEWYRFCFPSNWARFQAKKIKNKRFVTGEASATYYYSPYVPHRIKEYVPNVKLIVVLRNPVERAYSLYNKMVYHGFETLSFEEAIQMESRRIEGELEKMKNDPTYFSEKYLHHAYLDQGIYVDKLKEWYQVFSKDQILVLSTEDLANHTAKLFQDTIEFLQLESWTPSQYGRFNVYEKKEMNEDTRKKLADFFKPHNERLYKFLGIDFGWD